ncbi:hypothetical protein ABNP32_12615 [Pseudomonas viridiflava]|uniref:hypothetical protein n=1 Tax=Pseudomonas taiwanensis TaxID=470150 RepID=UPI0028E06D01|nr:hypothetical protein [Pseudomonas taiwanensis]MDT8923326.1 hypothetical protein [Pseudomonas taiwanensis]
MAYVLDESDEMRAIKSRAKKLKIELRIKHHAALELAARDFGYLNFLQAKRQPRPTFPGFRGMCRAVIIDELDECACPPQTTVHAADG